MPRVLLLSATTGYQLRSFDEAATRLGIELLFATDRCHQLDDPWRDRAVAVRFHDGLQSIAAVDEAARARRFDAVLAVGDRPLILASRLAARFGLPGNPTDAAAASGDKLAARRRFSAGGLPGPWHVCVPLQSDPHEILRAHAVAFPCVLKPLSLSGSRGVIRADTPETFVAAYERIRALLNRVDVRAARTGLEDAILIEQFIPGREVAVEGVLTAGTLQVFAIFDKPDPLDGPFFEETIYVTPPALAADVVREVAATVQRACDALGLQHGPVHAECRLGPHGVVVLEAAARPIGGLCSRALRFTGGRSLEEILLRHALGEDVLEDRLEPGASAVMMIPIPKRGLLRRVDGQDAARAVAHVEDVRITARPDQLIEPLPEAGSYLGFIFARAEQPADVEAAVRESHARLQFTIDTAIDVAAR